MPLAERAYANYWGNPGSSFDPARSPLSRHESRIARTEEAKLTLTTFTLTSDLKPDTPKPRVRPYSAPGIRGDRPQRGRHGLNTNFSR